MNPLKKKGFRGKPDEEEDGSKYGK